MLLNEVVSKIYEKKWTMVANFSINMFPKPDFATLVGWGDPARTNEDLNLCLISIDTPEYTNNDISDYSGNMWRYNNGRDELFRFSMTFRDFNQMELYHKFVNIYNLSKDNYFDKVVLNVQVFNDADVGIGGKRVLFSTDCALIEGISQLQLNHSTKNQVAEFTVRFKCNSPLHAAPNSDGSVSRGI